MAQTAVLSVVDTARSSVSAYNEKNWDKARGLLSPGCVYDEVGTNRKVQGINDVVALWQGWARAFPDSKATFDNELTMGNTVVLELTWRGTHTGPLQTPRGDLAPTGKKIEVRACQVIEVAGDKAKMIRQYLDMAGLLKQLGVTA
jgi:steroid delta-isomerase-like uncharacterized protein